MLDLEEKLCEGILVRAVGLVYQSVSLADHGTAAREQPVLVELKD